MLDHVMEKVGPEKALIPPAGTGVLETLLRMLSLDASLIHDDYAAVPSSKLDVLFEQLEDANQAGLSPGP